MLYNNCMSEPNTDTAPNAPANRADNRTGRHAGLFITIEGIDGSGKSTQAERLREALQARNQTVLQLREPGGTRIGEAIRQVLLAKESDGMSAETELLLFEAARAQLVRTVIEPALAAGSIVLSDRFMDSTVAYQGYGRGMDLDLVDRLNAFAIGRCKPHLTILLDLEPEQAMARLGSRPGKTDRLDDEGIAFMRRTRDGYLKIAERDPDRYRILKADLPEDALLDQILTILKEGFDI